MNEKIVVLTNGWVLIGELQADAQTLEKASVVRNWGTTKGLGEIALNGPTSSTVLDKCGTVKLNTAAVLFIINCSYRQRK
jgi:hypothetical protein